MNLQLGVAFNCSIRLYNLDGITNKMRHCIMVITLTFCAYDDFQPRKKRRKIKRGKPHYCSTITGQQHQCRGVLVWTLEQWCRKFLWGFWLWKLGFLFWKGRTLGFKAGKDCGTQERLGFCGGILDRLGSSGRLSSCSGSFGSSTTLLGHQQLKGAFHGFVRYVFGFFL